MRKHILYNVLIAFVFVLSSCAEKHNVIQKSLLEKTWSHATEEERSKDVEIYRPSDFKEFPASRYRQVFDFEADGVCQYLVLSPTDAHAMETGTWKYDGTTNRLSIFNGNMVKIYDYEIEELSQDILKLKAKI